MNNQLDRNRNLPITPSFNIVEFIPYSLSDEQPRYLFQ
jgi:hypothetical protein